MRIAVAVVVGLVFLGSGYGVDAKEPRRERSERCLEICNFDFEQCQASEGSKGPGRCNIDVVRCKNACPLVTVEDPAVPTFKSQQRCIDDCRLIYKKCQGQAENKAGGNCAADDMRCEKACPAPPEAATAPAAAPGTAGSVAPAGSTTSAPVPPKSKPRRAARVEGAAAPAPAPATPAPPVAQRVESPPPTVRSGAAAAPEVAPAEASAGSARPARAERGFFGTLGCFFVACEPAGSSPCLQQCATNYDECQVRESKRGGECNTRLMNCRKDCSATPAR
jgi:hypothetical protein